MEKALSGNEMMRIVKNKAKLLTYPQLKQYKTLDDLMKPYGAVILLYLTHPNYGHWVGIIQHPDRIEMFDSYGIVPDDELKFASMKFREDNDMISPYLLNLFAKSGLPVEYNSDKLQKFAQGVNTCGRWVALRILLRNMDLKEFVKFVKKMRKEGIPPDELVVKLIKI